MRLIDDAAHLNRWRTWHPLEKILLSIGMLVLTLLLPPWPLGISIGFLMAGATLFGAKIPLRIYLKVLSAPLIFLAVGNLPLLVSVDFNAGSQPFRLNFNNIEDVLQLNGRALTALTCLSFLALTTPLPELMLYSKRCGFPRAALEIALLIYNIIFVLFEETHKIRLAQDSRLGYSSLKNAYRSLGILFGRLLGRSLRRSKNLERGLAARGFQGELKVLWTPPPVSYSRLGMILGLFVAFGIFALLFYGGRP